MRILSAVKSLFSNIINRSANKTLLKKTAILQQLRFFREVLNATMHAYPNAARMISSNAYYKRSNILELNQKVEVLENEGLKYNIRKIRYEDLKWRIIIDCVTDPSQYVVQNHQKVW